MDKELPKTIEPKESTPNDIKFIQKVVKLMDKGMDVVRKYNESSIDYLLPTEELGKLVKSMILIGIGL